MAYTMMMRNLISLAFEWVYVIHCLLPLAQVSRCSPEFVYHNHEDLTQYLQATHKAWPQHTYLYTIGKSLQDRDLWVMALSGVSPDQHVLLRPEIKYIGNMHGNEVVSREVLLHFIHHLLTNYGTDPEITGLLDSARIHIMVSMNPDGFERAYTTQTPGADCTGYGGRFNVKGVDLNRNFPDFFRPEINRVQEQETVLVREWLHNVQFVLSANLHGGALVANYPYDGTADGIRMYSRCDDDDVFRHLATTYSSNHPSMPTSPQCAGDYFPGGITNGAQWYVVYGSMQDYNYIQAGCFEILVEISCCKFPVENRLSSFWQQNKASLLAYLQQVNMGVKGLVMDETGNPIGGAQVFVDDRLHHVNSTAEGEYWRLLLPGNYTIRIEADQYYSRSMSVHVPFIGDVAVVNISLTKDPNAQNRMRIFNVASQSHHAHTVHISCLVWTLWYFFTALI